MACGSLPRNVRKLAPGETFCFACHPGIACFTECCRELELELTPYDVLRIRRALGISSGDFFDRYGIVEQEEHDAYPHVFLTMIDDGRASCPFVSAAGCRIYADRPGACRTYPVGRAARFGKGSPAELRVEEFHVLVSESHCRGFTEDVPYSAASWSAAQGLTPYTAMNDEVMRVLQHPAFKDGLRLDPRQADKFLLALYRLDEFNALRTAPEFPAATAGLRQGGPAADDEEELLRIAVQWLRHELFNETAGHE